jgi:hypothetical protein
LCFHTINSGQSRDRFPRRPRLAITCWL